jgi:hypothetical protein
MLKYKENFPPPRAGRVRVGVKRAFFQSFGEGEGEGGCFLNLLGFTGTFLHGLWYPEGT